jgi:hypothetical protein
MASPISQRVVNATSHWFERTNRNSEPWNHLGEEEHEFEFGIWSNSVGSSIEVRSFIEMGGSWWSLRYELGVQFQIDGDESPDQAAMADFVRSHGGPFVVGMLREAIASGAASVGLSQILMPYHLEDAVRTMADTELVGKAE